jgi:hypothetical protein
VQLGPSPNEATAEGRPSSKGLHIRFNHPIEGALMMIMLDEYVRWALKPPFGGHYGGLMLVKKKNT